MSHITNIFNTKMTDKPFSLGLSKETGVAIALGAIAGLGALYYYFKKKNEQPPNTQLALTGEKKRIWPLKKASISLKVFRRI